MKLENLIKRYEELEAKIFEELSKKVGFGDDCNCKGETVKMIHEGEFDEVMIFCVECGGVK